MSLKDISLSSFYNGVDANIGVFYTDCLENSILYQRLSGYFRSGYYQLLKRSIADFASQGGKIQLVCSPDFEESDVGSIQQGYKMRDLAEKAIHNEITEEMRYGSLNKLKYDFIAALIALNALDIKVAYKTNKKGIFHSKISVFTDSDGDFVTTNGSNNETTYAVHPELNWESFDTFTSWVPGISDHASAHKKEFENVWEGSYAELTTIPFPDHTQDQIRKLSSGRDIHLILDEYEKEVNRENVGGKRSLPVPRMHQSRALSKWIDNDYKGIFKHATGSGKTVSAMMAIKEWFDHHKGTVLVTVPSKLLLNQWNEELKNNLSDYEPKILMVGDNNNRWKAPGILKAFSQNNDGRRNSIILGILASLKSPQFLNTLEHGKHLLVVSDEVHNNGAKETSKILTISAGGKLGLSATPERYSDSVGTKWIMEYFGGIIDSYSLENAINDGHLTNYNYYPIQITLTQEEIEKWETITKQIKKAYATYMSTHDPRHHERYQLLIIKRARIIKGAQNKVSIPANILNSDYKNSEKWIIYCDDNKQLQEVKGSLNKHGYSPLEYHYKMESPQKSVLDKFRDMGGILLSINCLDEGVDIPSLTHAIILASSQNPRQFIQRRGRVLRRYPGKYLANIYDCVVVPPNPLNKDLSDESIYTGELARAFHFSQSALNASSQLELFDLASKFDINIPGLSSVILDEDLASTEEEEIDE